MAQNLMSNFGAANHEWIVNPAVNYRIFLKQGLHIVVTVVKIESRSFTTTYIQQFRTENGQHDYEL